MVSAPSAARDTATPPRPWRRPRLGLLWFILLAALSAGTWLLVESELQRYTHPRYLEMVAAARTVQAAIQVIREEKLARGLLQPADVDPNRTGLIGPEWSEIATSLGVLPAKRTATNPDLAAAVVRNLASLPPRAGSAAIVLVSGSFVGGNIAALAAVQELGLRPIVVSSLGASLWGATDPDFNWLEIEATLRGRGLLGAKSVLALLGGDASIWRSMSEAGQAALRASAARHEVPLLVRERFADLVPEVLARTLEAAGGAARVGVFVNVGGALVALGTCSESHLVPTGLIRRPLHCTGGTAGLIGHFSALGIPVLHILNLRQLGLEYGLPYDPVPLPPVGENPRVYGGLRK